MAVTCADCKGFGARPSWRDHPDEQPDHEWPICETCMGHGQLAEAKDRTVSRRQAGEKAQQALRDRGGP